MATIKLRVDDFPGGMPEERYTQQGKDLLSYLESRNILYYLGVIPEILKAQDVHYLKTLKCARFCIHGFDHGFYRWRPNSEFDGMNEIEMEIRLQNAHQILEELLLEKVFIPPFNMFNQALINVLARNGYETITGGPETYNQMNLGIIDLKGIKLVTSTGDLYSSNGNLHEMLTKVPTCGESQQVVVHLNGNYRF